MNQSRVAESNASIAHQHLGAVAVRTVFFSEDHSGTTGRVEVRLPQLWLLTFDWRDGVDREWKGNLNVPGEARDETRRDTQSWSDLRNPHQLTSLPQASESQ